MLSPAFLFIAEHLKVELPSWFTAEDAKYLEGNSRYSNIGPFLNLKGISSGDLQTAIEEEVEQYIPLKASCILDTAALQRSFIVDSNVFFNWNCYPTFYGSSYAYSPSQNTTFEIAEKETESNKERIESFINDLEDYAKQNPDIKFIMYFAPSSRDTNNWNPTNHYVSNAWDYYRLEKFVDENCKIDASNFEILFWDAPDDAANTNFFHYDHHWNINGALNAYSQICEAAGIDPLDFGDVVELNVPPFYGSQSRESLNMLFEKPFDLTYDFSNLEVIGKDRDAASHSVYWDSKPIKQAYDFHELWYGDIRDTQINGGKGDNRILLVGDSYANALIRPLAESSSSLQHDRSLYRGEESDNALSELIKEQDADTVIFVARSADFGTFAKNNPHFFE